MLKKIPMRMCIACRQMVVKPDLIRVVRNKNAEYKVDFTGAADGRGAYICNKPECITKCIKTRALNRAYKENISPDVYDSIQGEYDSHKD